VICVQAAKDTFELGKAFKVEVQLTNSLFQLTSSVVRDSVASWFGCGFGSGPFYLTVMTSKRFMSAEDLSGSDSVFVKSTEEVAHLRSRLDTFEQQMSQRMETVERLLINETRSYGLAPARHPFRALAASASLQRVKSESDVGHVTASCQTCYPACSADGSACLLVHGVSTDKFNSADRNETKKFVKLFFRETLGMTWEDIWSLSISDCWRLHGNAESKGKRQTSVPIVVKFDRASDAAFVKSRAAVAKIQGFYFTELSTCQASRSVGSRSPDHPKALKKKKSFRCG